MTSEIPPDLESECENHELNRDEASMSRWLRQSFRRTRLTSTAIVDELRAELPPSLLYWSEDRSERLAMYRDAALQHASAEYVATLRGGGGVHLSVIFIGVDDPVVVEKDTDRISLQIPYELATIFAIAILRLLAPYKVQMTTRRDKPVR
ncbi:MAG: hypothetical protein P4L11_00145 [Geothrix sp.]|nr:hypothetical protein [Geothrix sp.]